MNVQPDMNQPRTSASDSRALQNLVKAEKAYVDQLFTATSSAVSANSSLQAWGMSETPDLESAALTVSKHLDEVLDAQKTYAHAIDHYRSALKDVLDREQTVRTILRDREILISRVIKLSKKKPSRWEVANYDDDHNRAVEAALAELHACEQALSSETAFLIGVKRRTFKEAMTMRVKTLGDTGAAMMDSARSIIMFLDDFDANLPVAPPAPLPLPEQVSMVAHRQQRQQQEFEPPFQMENAPQGAYQDYHDANEQWQQHPYAEQWQQPYEQQVYEPLPYEQGLPYEQPQAYEQAYEQQPQAYPESAADLVPSYPPGAVPAFVPSRGVVSPVPLASPAMSSPAPQPMPAPKSKSRRTQKPHRRMSDASRNSSLQAIPQVPGGIPSAPKMNLEHARDGFVAPTVPGGVPSAPRIQFGRDDEDDEDRYRRHETYSNTTTTDVPRERHSRYTHDDDESGTRSQKQGGFFSRMSNLFRSELKAQPSSKRHEERGGRRVHSESFFSPISDSRSRALRDDSSDEEPSNVVRHYNERPLSSMNLHMSSSKSRNQQASRASAAAAEEDALTAAVRRSVIGAGITGNVPGKGSKPSSRSSSALGHGTRVNRRSVDSDVRPGSAASVSRPKSRNSVDQAEKPVRRKRRESATPAISHPPPAPSSFYGGLASNPAKFTTDSWVTKAEDLGRPSSAQSAKPLKSAMKSSKSHRVSSSGSDLQSLSINLDGQFDGTGHLDLELAEMVTSGRDGSPVKPAATQPSAAAPPITRTLFSNMGAKPVSQEDGATLGAAEEATYRAFLQEPASVHEGNDESVSRSAQLAAPFYATTHLAPQAQEAPVPAHPMASHTSKKSVRIESEPALCQPVSPHDDRHSSWNTRIGAHDDSSDEESTNADPDTYTSARQAFGSATRQLGLATGTLHTKPKGESTKRKSRPYNPSIQLPKGMETVARSRP
ncbi:hypothetical protein MVES1_002511 [Malassezia vespertilionis]|uniref:uncharacterized protein n=1 Tax=Malassezia vespertilionis TaxID=2020962 RepID=UPI0024B08FAA|nr:uncharacterized protein MVES1_002511 [Malassezia vespertilionis]WFD07153.1 hypothetical protein MVES1_002511 [Malassezia vespertilionis]